MTERSRSNVETSVPASSPSSNGSQDHGVSMMGSDAPFVSYAQSLEDVLLWRALASVGGGVYVDIGAQDPIIDSVSKGFYLQGWRGVHVEPAVEHAEALRKDRPDELVIQAAVSATAGLADFHVIPGTGQSTALADIAEKANELGFVSRVEVVPTITLDQVLERVETAEIHWLKIDVEGLEEGVLRGWRTSSRRPWVVVVESTMPLSRVESFESWEPLLAEKGYSFVYSDGVNRFYVSQQHSDLAGYFSYGPSIWDNYQVSGTNPRVSQLAQAFFAELAAARSEGDTATAEIARIRPERETLTVRVQQAEVLAEARRVELESNKLELVQSGVLLRATREQLQESNASLVDTRDALETARVQLGQSHSELDRSRARTTSAEEALKSATAALDHERLAHAATQGRLDHSKEELKGAGDALREASTALDHERRAHAATQARLDDLKAELSRIADAFRVESKALHADVEHLQCELESSQKKLKLVELSLGEHLAELEAARADLRSTQGKLAQAQANTELVTEQLRQSHGVLDQERASNAANAAQLTQSQAVLDQTRDALRRASARSAALEGFRRERDLAFAEVEGLRVALDHLQGYADRMAGELEGARKQLREAEAEIVPAAAVHSEAEEKARTEIRRLDAERAGLMRGLTEARGWWSRWWPSRSAFSDGQAGFAEGAGAVECREEPVDCVQPESVWELLLLRDDRFVRAAFLVLTGALPKVEVFNGFVRRVRSGEDPRSIVVEIARLPGAAYPRPPLAGLDRLVRQQRWKSFPILGSFIGTYIEEEERAAVRVALRLMESRLERLMARSLPIGALQVSVAPASLGENADGKTTSLGGEGGTAAGVQSAPVPHPEAPKAPRPRNDFQIEWSRPLVWDLDEFAGEALLPSTASRELKRAFMDLGHRVVSTRDRPDAVVDANIVLEFPLTEDERAAPNRVLVAFDRELDPDFLRRVGGAADGLAAVAASSSQGLKMLRDSGVWVPAASVGIGVDEWERVLPNPDYHLSAKAFRFLHVSRCDSASGFDALLQSYGYVFSSSDDVSLIVAPEGGALPLDAGQLLAKLQGENPYFPDVVVLGGRLSESDTKALYNQCQVFVAPCRINGFGLPIARALLQGLPVVATNWGGHLDYCDDGSAWLVDFKFVPAMHGSGGHSSVWAEPWPAHLDTALKTAFGTTSQERLTKAWLGRRRLLADFTWKDVALRLAALVGASSPARRRPLGSTRLGWVSSWNVHCGIAGHVAHLLDQRPLAGGVVFAAKQEPRITPDDGPNAQRCWVLAKENNCLADVAAAIRQSQIDVVVVQHNYAFFNHSELSAFVLSSVAQGTGVILELHSTHDPFGDSPNWRLAELADAMRACIRVIVHSPADVDVLKSFGVVTNVLLLPHGVMRFERSRHPDPRDHLPLVATFGFCFPNKGLVEIVEAVALLRKQGRPVRLRMLNAISPHEFSAPVATAVVEAIERLELGDLVEPNFDYLSDEDCLQRLADADLIVNPYQHTGESASGAVRYGLATGRPTAVTPLPIFDDLGEAVFRMPGITPIDMAEGIARTLEHISSNSREARRIASALASWVDEHDYARHAARLAALAHSFVAVDRLEPENGHDGEGEGAFQLPRRKPRGAFINTAHANCSIFESGRMVWSSLRGASEYDLEYFSLDMLDLSAFATTGELRVEGREVGRKQDYDFWVFNWHFITMAPHIADDTIRALPGSKFTVVLELEPGNPLALVPPNVFDGFIALDPTAHPVSSIFAFPRPLEGEARSNRRSIPKVPVIGSFGFGTPGKGFEFLVEAVNKEFDRAIVRINVPFGTYTSSTDAIHGKEYPKYLAEVCRRIAKPGVEVAFTHAFMTPDELLDWCADNDLNCFMYTRRQSGLSATTDQAIMSGRPLLTSTNDTFRHIHKYIPPYPVLSLREALETTGPLVRQMQKDWSRDAFKQTFIGMLQNAGLLTTMERGTVPAPQRRERLRKVHVAVPRATNQEDILSYMCRVKNALGRSGLYMVDTVLFDDLNELEVELSSADGDALILDGEGIELETALSLVSHFRGEKLILREEVEVDLDLPGVHFLPRNPLIPYFTSAAGLRTVSPSIWLVGFACHGSNLEGIIERIKQEIPDAEILVYAPETQKVVTQQRLYALQERFSGLGVHSPDLTGESLIANFTVCHLTIFYNDHGQSRNLLDMCALAMTTERPVAFTKASSFEVLDHGATFVEDVGVLSIIEEGLAAHIELYREFGEWQLYARVHSLLSESKPSQRT